MARFKFHFSIFWFKARPILVDPDGNEIASWPRWFSRKIIFSLSQYFKKSIHCDIHFDLKKTKKRNNPYEGNFFFQKLDLSLSLKPVYKIFLSLLKYPKWITIPKKKQCISSNSFQPFSIAFQKPVFAIRSLEKTVELPSSLLLSFSIDYKSLTRIEV